MSRSTSVPLTAALAEAVASPLRTVLFCLAAALPCASASLQTPAQSQSLRAYDAAETRGRSLLDEGRGALEEKDAAAARARAAEGIDLLLADTAGREDALRLSLIEQLGVLAEDAGDLHAAERARRRVVEGRERTLPDDDPQLQAARVLLALAIKELGDVQGARVLEEKVLEVCERTLPADHVNLQGARINLASTIKLLGDVRGAMALEERVVECLTRTRPGDAEDLQIARLNLAGSRHSLGDLAGARSLEEMAYEVLSRTLPDDHVLVQTARMNLAVTLKALGDISGGRELEEKALAIWARSLPDDHPNLQRARLNLAVTMIALGEQQAARELLEKVVETRSNTLPEDHPELQLARSTLAGVLKALGDLEGARALFAKVLEIAERTLPENNPDRGAARNNLAATLATMGEVEEARTLFEESLVISSRTLPADHPQLQVGRENLALETARLEALAPAPETKARFGALVREFAAALRRACLVAILDSSSREAEERVACRAGEIGMALSLADGLGVVERVPRWDEDAFLASEVARSVALSSERFSRRARSSPEHAAAAARARETSAELTRLAQGGSTSDEFSAARRRLDEAERALVHAAATLGGAGELDPTLDRLASRVDEGTAMVAYRRYAHTTLEGATSFRTSEQLCAFVVRRDRDGEGASLHRVELGRMDPIADAVDAWRQSIGVGRDRGVSADPEARTREEEHGAELRGLVLDPLREALGDVRRVVVVLDDVLHGVPLDALPAGGPWETEKAEGEVAQGHPPLGARLRIEVRSSLLEVQADEERPKGNPVLLALGHAAFDALPLGPDEAEDANGTVPAVARPEESKDGGWDRGFATLPETRAEIRGIRDYFVETFGEKSEALVLERRRASRESLFALAPRARFLHVATHGWFAPESIRSFDDPGPLDGPSVPSYRTSFEERVRGSSPMLLCGLALAGANRPAGPTGRIPGLVTAEELATLDLSACELAVLSACDTNVGIRRAGQGVASLQRALQMAGARSVVTSLWRVPDEATKELMVDFYRRIWVEKKPKAQALWEAKMRLRAQKDESGRPRYSTRDWAAWVLTGAPE